MIPERFWNRDILASHSNVFTVLHVPDNIEHKFHLLVDKNKAFFCQVSYFLLCPRTHILVHPSDSGVGGVDCLAACDSCNGLCDFTDAEDSCRNAPERLLFRERVDLRLRPGDIKVREYQDVVQGDAVQAVCGMKNYPQKFCILGDLAADRRLHCLDARQTVGDGTDSADPRGNLRDLFHRLAYGELLNTPDRGDREPVSSLDYTLIVHLQGKLGVPFMSRGWRDLYNFRQWYCLVFD